MYPDRSATLSTLDELYKVCGAALKARGGLIRQFIIDDKGCVFIGNFGLPKSNTIDNCAQAVAAAHDIEDGLGALNLQPSIGISNGTAYCGLVGAAWRFEYSVMGTGVNLAARLMMATVKPSKTGEGDAKPDGSQASIGNIRCDIALKQGDRSHSYVGLSAISAKGYADPVPTFRPIRYVPYDPFAVVETINGYALKKPVAAGSLIGGRLGEIKDSIDFFLEPWNFSKLQPADIQSKILVVVGPESIGTEAYLTLLSNILNSLDWGYICFRCRARMSNSSTRFALWKNIFGDMLTRLGTYVLSHSSASVGKKGQPVKLVAFDFINARLPPATREWAPLLIHFGLLPKSLEITLSASLSRLSGSDKLEKSVEFMTQALEVAAEYLKKSVSGTALVIAV
jgi:hypothetical protein